ncbi:Phytosulfokine receptor, partial [Thalictrum thalictroides]
AHVLNSQNQTCNSDDLEALRDIQKGLKSGTDSWATADCCSWFGIICKSSSSVGLVSSKRVVGLELGSRKLNGSLPSSFLRLNQLRYLNLSRNFLSGDLPINLFVLQNLEVLDLSDNDFSGIFPGNISLPSIQFLDVSQNSLHGTITPSMCNQST